ncbi:MAG: DUF6134 family protein [Ferruginibacter sp.]
MLPLLIILYIKNNKEKLQTKYRHLLHKKAYILKFIALTTALLIIGKIASSQSKYYQYGVKKGSSNIGRIVLNHTISGDISKVSLVSDIKYRFVLLFTASSKEEVVFTNGVMTLSSLCRIQNGDKIIDSKTKKATGNYIVVNDNKEAVLNIPAIYYQTLCLYTNEPGLCKYVYVDKFQQLISIQKTADHEYKVVFPDGNYNEYFYQDGICRLVKVHQSLFTVRIELEKIL